MMGELKLMHASPKQAILASTCVIFSLIGPLIYWLGNHESQSNLRATRFPVSPASVSPRLPSKPQHLPDSWNFPKLSLPWFANFSKNASLDKRVSLGEKILVSVDNSPFKEAGVEKFKAGQFEEAISAFRSSLKDNRNDPEALIYLNNARAVSNGNFVKVVVSVPIGSNVNVAKEILRGVAQAQDKVNQEHEIQGKSLQVLIANDENNPEIGKALAVKLADDSSLVAVIGHQSSDVSVAVAPVYDNKGVVMISPTSYSRDLTGIGKFIFRTTPSSRVFADALAKYSFQVARNKKFAICSDSKSRASKSFREDFESTVYVLGGQITRTVCNFSAPDFNPDDVVSQATSDGATSLLLAPGVEQLKKAIAVMQTNQGRLSIVASHSMYTFETLQQGMEAANGVIMEAPWDPSAEIDSTYLKDARKFWGGPGNWRTAMAYDATTAITAGLKIALSRQGLQKVLSTPGFSVKGATGVVQFLPTGDRNKAGTLVKVVPGKVSGTGYDFKPLKLKTITGKD
ncbi:MAG: ABC transporter substrate-binding protein [Acaryochloridaceae cyanobacterium RU_4_10]|nr:ABC transporter substrate-binding protein [Acaryochloridaceae cyanobacterium RU_4_10]